jgi:hypothetical protein
VSATPTGGRRGIVKTRITITVLHRSDNPMTDHGIDEVLYEMSEGDAVGWETGRDTVPVDPNDVGAELIALGNDGTFFDEDEDEYQDVGAVVCAAPAAAPLPEPWEDDPEFPMEGWRYEVYNGDELCGYRDWVAKMRECRDEDPDGAQL